MKKKFYNVGPELVTSYHHTTVPPSLGTFRIYLNSSRVYFFFNLIAFSYPSFGKQLIFFINLIA